MSVTITDSKDLPYNHATGFAIDGIEGASDKLQEILKKIKINTEDIKFKINSEPSNGLSFFNNTRDKKFLSELSELKEEDIKETNIEIENFQKADLSNVTVDNISDEYGKLRDKIIELIKQLIADKQEVFFESNVEEAEEKIPQNQQVNAGSPANDNNHEVDELNKKYIKRDDDLHQVRVSYKKTGQAEQTRHIVFGNEILKKGDNVNSHEETAKKMVDLYSQEKEKRLIVKDNTKSQQAPAILDSVDYEKEGGKITGVNVCYSQATTEAIAAILNQPNPNKEDFIKKTKAYRTAIYILIPGSNKGEEPRQYAKYQLTPSNGELVFEMEKKSFTRGVGGKFEESETKIKEEDKKNVPPADKFQIYQTDKEQKQSLWNDKKPDNLVAPTQVRVTGSQSQRINSNLQK